MFLVCSLVMGVLIVGFSCLGWFSGAEETFPWKINFDTSFNTVAFIYFLLYRQIPADRAHTEACVQNSMTFP